MSAQRSFCSLLGFTRSGTASDRPFGLGNGSITRTLMCDPKRVSGIENALAGS